MVTRRLLLASAAVLPWTLGEAHLKGRSPMLAIDFAARRDRLRPLHGVNKGPLVAGGLVDIGDAYRRLEPPLARLHDCHWPTPDVVDLNVVFPRADADPDDPRSYDFAATDVYVRAIADAGVPICWRLGQSIEHAEPRRFVHPPADPERWARACIGVVRHYNDGWADGMRLGIRYWEVWNEPEVRPQMWTGTDEEFLRLYITASRALKQRFPRLAVGGPGLASPGSPGEGGFVPAPFAQRFLRACRQADAPLDFLSWHVYTSDARALPALAHGVRGMLNAAGFERSESHLNEWNYLPGGDWAPMQRGAAPAARRAWYARMAGNEAAAFAAAGLIRLQDAPLDAACLYHGETGWFGLFDECGVARAPYHALLAFRELLRTPLRAGVTGADAGALALAAGLAEDQRSARALVALPDGEGCELAVQVRGLPWEAGRWSVRALQGERGLVEAGSGRLDDTAVALAMEPHGVALFEFTPQDGNPK